jgi:hypothetical protein
MGFQECRRDLSGVLALGHDEPLGATNGRAVWHLWETASLSPSSDVEIGEAEAATGKREF